MAAFGISAASLAWAAPSVLTTLYATAPTGGLQLNAAGELFGTEREGIGGNIFKLAPPAPGQAAWTSSVIYTFTGNGIGSTDGESPSALLIDEGGNIFGTTLVGGAAASGTLFQLNPPVGSGSAWHDTILYQFGGRGVGDGENPSGALLPTADGGWIGTTQYGGAWNAGMVYKIAYSDGAWTTTALYSFNGRREGSKPEAGVISDAAGNLYGTTVEGARGSGTVFRLTPPVEPTDGWTLTTLYTFTGGADGGRSSGKLVLDRDGALLGTAEFGGNKLRGVIFKLSPGHRPGAPWTETVIHAFAGGSDGGKPRAGLLSDGRGGYYGSASGGGIGGRGTVFQLTPPVAAGGDWTLKTLHYFRGGTDGIGPFGDLLLRDGKLYGITQGSQLGSGTVFMLEP